MSTFMDTDIRYLKGVGEKRAAQFHKLGIGTVGELLYTFPRYYEDWKHVYAINEAPLGEKTCIRAVVSFKASVYRTPGGTVITKTSATAIPTRIGTVKLRSVSSSSSSSSETVSV